MTRGRAIVMGVVLLVGGCAGEGYTRELAKDAGRRMDALRADTELRFAAQSFAAENLERAAERVRAALAIDPQNPTALVMAARIELERGRPAAAVNAARAATEADESNAEPFYVLGITLEHAGSLEEAAEAYATACALAPEDEHAMIAYAEVVAAMGFPEAAEQAVSDWQGHRYHAGTLQLLGHLSMRRGDPERAVAWLESARVLEPEDDGLTEDLVLALISTDRHGDALALLMLLNDRVDFQARPDLRHQLAVCYRATGRSEDARRVLVRLAEGAPRPEDRARYWSAAGRLALETGDLGGVREAASRVVAAAPRSPDGYILWAAWYASTGDHGGLRASVEAGLERASNPDQIGLLTELQAAIEREPSAGEPAIAEVGTDG